SSASAPSRRRWRSSAASRSQRLEFTATNASMSIEANLPWMSTSNPFAAPGAAATGTRTVPAGADPRPAGGAGQPGGGPGARHPGRPGAGAGQPPGTAGSSAAPPGASSAPSDPTNPLGLPDDLIVTGEAVALD